MIKKQLKAQNYSEADLILLFNLTRIKIPYTPLMTEWINTTTELSCVEQAIFDKLIMRAIRNIEGWQEEDLKMKFLSPILELAHFMDDQTIQSYFEKTVSATVNGYFLKTKTDFMLAKGILDKPQQPYFYLQEWKPRKKPYRDSMMQLLEALLITQELNQHQTPIYGCEVMGKHWSFVILEDKSYCISKSYDCTEQDDLLKIIAILRKFKQILETRLLN